MKYLAFFLLTINLLAGIFDASAFAETYVPEQANMTYFGELFAQLLRVYECPSSEDEVKIRASLAAISENSQNDYEIANAIVSNWMTIYADSNYYLYLHHDEDSVHELHDTDIPDSPEHAFIVLGYQLKNGKMTDELIGRCEAAAAAARIFPNTILVCSGGSTGSNNSYNHTEAGLMKDYLTGTCSINESRIFIDERARNTMQNATNTFEILMAQNVHTFTIVTSSYHQRWGQVLYNAMSAIYRQFYGYDTAIIANFCYDTEPSSSFSHDDRLAISQLASMLNLSDRAVRIINKAL